MAIFNIKEYIAIAGGVKGHYMTDWEVYLDREMTVLIASNLCSRKDLLEWIVTLRHPSGRLLDDADMVFPRARIYVGKTISAWYNF